MMEFVWTFKNVKSGQTRSFEDYTEFRARKGLAFRHKDESMYDDETWVLVAKL